MDMRKGKIKNWKWWGIVLLVSIGAMFLVGSTTLHVLGILPYPRTLPFFHVYVVIALAYFFSTGILYGKKMELSVKLLSLGVIFFALIAFADLVRHVLCRNFDIEHSLLELTLIPLGTLVFVLMLVGSYLVYLFRMQEVRAEKDFLATMAYVDSLTGVRNKHAYFEVEKSFDEHLNSFKNRLLSKLEHKIKITNGRDKIKSKRKTFSTTSISLGNNFKAFNKAYDIFDFNSLTGNTTVFEFIRRS